jgi:HdeA/HdeB family
LRNSFDEAVAATDRFSTGGCRRLSTAAILTFGHQLSHASHKGIFPMPNAYSVSPWLSRSLAICVVAGRIVAATSAAHAQVSLSTYTDAKGYIDVQALTCAQLANTFQEDADYLAAWYSGWYNGLAKEHKAFIARAKTDEHNVIVYCKQHPELKVIKAIDVMLKETRGGK